MYVMFNDLMQTAKIENGELLKPIITGSLADKIKMPPVAFYLADTDVGYHIVNAIGVVGKDIHSISLSSMRAVKRRPKGLDDKELIGLNRWLYRLPSDKTFGELLRISEVTNVKLTIGADGKRLVGLNRFLGLTRKRPGEVAWKYRAYKDFNYIHLYTFEDTILFNGERIELEIQQQDNKITEVSRVALGYAYQFPTGNKVEFGYERKFKEPVSGIGGVSTLKPNFYKRVVQFEIPYWLNLFGLTLFGVGSRQMFAGLPIFAHFDEEKIPVEHFYGTIDKAAFSSMIKQTLFETKLKITEAF